MGLMWTEKVESVRPSWVALAVLGILFGLGFVGLTGAIERPIWEVLTGSYGLSEAGPEAHSADRMDY